MYIAFIIAAICVLVLMGKLFSNFRNQKLERIHIENPAELDKIIEKYKFLDD